MERAQEESPPGGCDLGCIKRKVTVKARSTGQGVPTYINMKRERRGNFTT